MNKPSLPTLSHKKNKIMLWKMGRIGIIIY